MLVLGFNAKLFAGDDGMKEYTSRSSRKTSAQKTSGISQKFKDRFRIYFPSEETVVKSRGGRGVSLFPKNNVLL